MLTVYLNHVAEGDFKGAADDATERLGLGWASQNRRPAGTRRVADKLAGKMSRNMRKIIRCFECIASD